MFVLVFVSVCVCAFLSARVMILISVDSKASRFGDANQPGFQKEVLVAEKFASAAYASSPLSAMSQPIPTSNWRTW